MPSFLGGKSRGAFGQPAFFLAGNRMTIVAFEKEVSLKASASLAFNDCSRVLKFYT